MISVTSNGDVQPWAGSASVPSSRETETGGQQKKRKGFCNDEDEGRFVKLMKKGESVESVHKEVRTRRVVS